MLDVVNIVNLSKNTYKIAKNNDYVIIKLSSELGDAEILLNRNMSRDRVIFIPEIFPTVDNEGFAIIGTAYQYSNLVNSDSLVREVMTGDGHDSYVHTPISGRSYVNMTDKSLVTATIVESNLEMTRAKAFLEVNME